MLARFPFALWFVVWCLAGSGVASEPLISGVISAVDEWQDQGQVIRLASQVEQPIQPLDPFRRQQLDVSLAAAEGNLLREQVLSISLASRYLRELAQLEASPSADVVGRGEVQVAAPTDLGSLLQKSDDVQTVSAQRRSQAAFDPHVRGYHFGQIYSQSAGEYFLPVRLDLDSMLSKIDPYLIQTVTVIPGPYGLRYGPGLAFIDVVPINTPRSQSGPMWSNRANVTTRGNGSQILGQDTLSGGGQNYGFISAYGLRSGADYRAGNGQLIPSSYHSQNALLQLGWDTDNGRVEARYNRFDLWNTEYALQFFDVNSLQTDSFNLSYAGTDEVSGADQIAQIWWNQTKFNGDDLRASKNEIRQRTVNALNSDFNTNLNLNQFQGFVNGGLVSAGARAVRTYGEDAGNYTRVGTDFRYVTQSTFEHFRILGSQATIPFEDGQISTNQPHSVLIDPGMFAESSTAWTSYFNTTVGGRVDYVNTKPRASEYDDDPSAPGLSNVAFNQNDVLLAGYLTGELVVTDEWSIRSGVGYAERVPDLINRYADGVFLGILQDGASRIIGRPALKKERATQADVSAVANYEYATCRATCFYSWIDDYNTYTAFPINLPAGAQFLLATNTALATLGGAEFYGDYRATDVTTFFASLQYVRGIDVQIHRSLPQIYPLQSRLGVRWADPSAANDWGLEWGFRLVAAQNQIGYLRDGNSETLRIAVESPTAGFYTSYVRGYYNLSQQVHLVGGIDNMFNRNYLEHLDLRLKGPAATPGGVTAAFAPGFTAYVGLEWVM